MFKISSSKVVAYFCVCFGIWHIPWKDLYVYTSNTLVRYVFTRIATHFNDLINKYTIILFVSDFLEGASAEEQCEFLREIKFMKNVGCHRNIITMAACSTKDNKMFLVVEYAPHGDLLSWLKAKRNRVSGILNQHI